MKFILFFVLTSSCAYKLSNKSDTLPKNVKSIFIPVFKNKTSEPLVETIFTDALRSETLRSGYAEIANSESTSDAVMSGTITFVDIVADESVIEARDTLYLPRGNLLSKLARITVTVELVLKKKGSSEILWSSGFTQSRSYTPPQLTLPTINSANSLYNLSIRRQTLTTLSKEMMQLAFDRLVDNF
jgi:TolB-like protein